MSVMVLLPTIMLLSCDDPHDPDIELSGDISMLIPPQSVNLGCSYSITNKNIHLEAEPMIYIDFDRWGLKIDKVEYFIDETLCETKTYAPYKFTYESHEWNSGAHTLRVELTISGDNVDTLILPYTKVLNNSSSGVKNADNY